MLSPSRLWRCLSNIVRTSQRDAELEEELSFHIDREAQRLVEHGMDAQTAHQEARRRFGSVVHAREGARDARGVRLVEDCWRDLRLGARTLKRQPVFTIVAVTTLAVGIGATTAIFGAVYGVLLAPLPYASSNQLVHIVQTAEGVPSDAVAPANFLDWHERQQAFSAIAAAEPFSLDYVGPDGPERFSNAIVTRDWFDVLRVEPLLGRTLDARDYEPTANLAAVMSESVWRTRFGGDTGILGRTLVLDSQPTVIVGVLPASVDLPWQMWTPKRTFRDDERASRNSTYFTVLARVGEGTTIDMARQDLQRVSAQLATEYPATNAKVGAEIRKLDDVMFGPTRKSLWLMFSAGALLLLIACSNVASMQLAQALRRERELSVRVALGAGQSRLIRQLLVESLVIALVGGALGVALAIGGLGVIRRLAPPALPRVEQLALTPEVVLFAFGISLIAALVVAASPIREASRAFGSGASGPSVNRHVTASRRTRSAQRVLVGAQVAMAFVLLTGAGLLVRSLNALLDVPRGFETQGIVNVTLQAWSYYPTAQQRTAFTRELTERLEAIPGVEQVGTTSSLPLSAPIGAEQAAISIPGVVDSSTSMSSVRVAAITPGYSETLRIPVVEGRVFTWDDRTGAPDVAVVNETFARRFWPGESPVGKRFTLRFQGPPRERLVVGVVGDVRHDGLHADIVPTVFVPHAQAPSGAMQIVARARGDLAAAQRTIRAELRAMNGVMPLSEITTLETRLSDSLRERRFNLSLLLAFAATALLLAAVGVYGVMNQLTTDRMREIGVRMAVGARAVDVERLLLLQGMRIAGVGLLTGILISIAATRFLGSMLYGIQPLDVATYATVIGLLLVVAIVATWLPARRGAAVDPMKVLRLD